MDVLAVELDIRIYGNIIWPIMKGSVDLRK